MFVDKAGAYLSEASLGCLTLGQAPGLTQEQSTTPERIARDKQPILLQKFVNYGRKKP